MRAAQTNDEDEAQRLEREAVEREAAGDLRGALAAISSANELRGGLPQED